ncbi:rhamnosyltransferase WsaF family glycosyltransferase [Herbiconiux ginsengi]|uniref:rhamnosyltransferase WsaF family glycosyltransferase n=1 Tax=Herbiconiux ginsengi TaxID=381665 RepID=UPI001587C276|nr:glycosyltransferase [Herbiconiux ginsengi]
MSIKRAVVDGLRKTLPPGSRSRSFAAAGFHSMRGAIDLVRTTRHNFAQVQSSEPGLESYSAWRRQQPAPSDQIPLGASLVSFTVIIEVAPGTSLAQVQKTRASVGSQAGLRVEIMEKESGSDIGSLVSGVKEDFVLFLRAGSTLEAHALADLAKKHRVDPGLALVAFDSDLRSATGSLSRPQFRPTWSPEMLLGANYLDRAFAVSSKALRETPHLSLNDLGVWRLLLDLDLIATQAGNVNRVLLHEPADWRTPATAEEAEMVREALERRGENAETSVKDGVVRVLFQPAEWPSVSIVIPTRHSRANLGVVLPSLARTDYPSFDVTVIDNGGESDANNEWYSANENGLDLSVIWWTEQPFNYSRVNNYAVRSTSGEVVLMLNDDTEIVDPLWLQEMVGQLMRPNIGTVGVQHRRGDGRIQHGGVTVGPGGSADNLFAGMEPGSDSLLGPTSWYRDSLAVTGACVAIRRTDFEASGGLAENFILCGSDVVLGLDQIIAGRRNVVVPFDTVRHLESVTRGSNNPVEDYYASYWRYSPWLSGGDPYSSPNVSRLTAVPRFSNRRDPSPVKIALTGMGRAYTKVAQNSNISAEAVALLAAATVSSAQVRAVKEQHASIEGRREVKTINWFIPDIDMPFFGGLNTAFRLADKLRRDHGVHNRFIVLGEVHELFIHTALTAAFPGLAEADIHFYDGSDASLAELPAADAAVATLWLTASHVAKVQGTPRKFYLMQDYEPAFYPASTMFAMAEESYRLGLYGICNTDSMHRIYTEEYKGKATYFTPAVDQGIYNAVDRRTKGDDEPVTIFAYARDHFRNCWEMVYAALSEIKRIHGDGVRIVAAGARYLPESADFIDMGLLDYRATGAVYRETDIGLTMQISRHPSYLPLELMSSGVPMVAPDSEWFQWIFDDGENSLTVMRTLDDVVEKLDTLVRDAQLRSRLRANALDTIARNHSSWDEAFEGIYDYFCDPEAATPR